MTIQQNDRRKEYPGNGVANVFTGPRAFSESHIDVFLIDAAGVSTLQAGGYTLSGVGAKNTVVTMDVAPPAGTTLLILRTVPYEQGADISNQGAYLPETLENAGLDPLAQQIQQLDDRVQRSLRMDEDVILPAGFSAVLPPPDALKPLVWSADAKSLQNGDPAMTGDMLLRGNLNDHATPGLGAKLVAWAQAAAGAVKRTVLDELQLILRPEHFGAKGDGVTDDSAAFLACQSAAGNRTIHLRSGCTYRINSALVFTSNVAMRSDGAVKAFLYHAGQAFVPLTVQGSSPGSQFLTASVTLGSRAWTVGVANAATPGQLMAVRSSASWYHDPRPGSTDTRKSELHRIDRVEGTVIYTEDGAADGYDIGSETVTLIFYNPVRVRLENIGIRCALPPEGVNAAAVSGIEIKWADEALLRDVDVEYAAGKGIGVTESYRPVIEGGHTYGANNYGTGYGVQTAGTAHAVIRGRRFYRCRRGIDVSGANIISRNTLIEANVVNGGGKNSEGTVYGWNADATTGADVNGFGSHGASDGVTYRGNVSANLHTHYDCRGRNEVIENNRVIGRSRLGVIAVSYGENLNVRGNTVYDGRSAMKNSTVYDGGANINTRRADYFINFYDTYEGKAVGQVVVEDNDVMCQDRFLNFTFATVGPVPNNVTLRNNKVRFATSGSTDPVYLAYNTDATQALPSGWNVLGNDVQRSSGTGRVNHFFNIDPRAASCSFNVMRSYQLFMADDTAAAIPVPSAGTRVRIMVDSGLSANGCLMLSDGSTSNAAFGTLSNIDTSITGVLSGTTGVDTKLNFSLSAGVLYVENRLGASQRVVLSIIHTV